MKCRSGFISNSSTSSFVLAGWKGIPSADLIRRIFHYLGRDPIQEDDEDIEDNFYEYMEDLDWTVMNEGDDGADLYGIYLIHIDDYGIEEIDLDTEELSSLNKLAKDLGLPPPKLYGGTRYC